jgi:hypothetical protein
MTRMPIKVQTAGFQGEIKTLLGIEIKAIHVTFWQRICLHFVHVLRL